MTIPLRLPYTLCFSRFWLRVNGKLLVVCKIVLSSSWYPPRVPSHTPSVKCITHENLNMIFGLQRVFEIDNATMAVSNIFFLYYSFIVVVLRKLEKICLRERGLQLALRIDLRRGVHISAFISENWLQLKAAAMKIDSRANKKATSVKSKPDE